MRHQLSAAATQVLRPYPVHGYAHNGKRLREGQRLLADCKCPMQLVATQRVTADQEDALLRILVD